MKNYATGETTGEPLEHDEWRKEQARLQNDSTEAKAKTRALVKEPADDEEPTFGKDKHPLSYFDDMTDEQARKVDGVGPKTLEDIKAAREERDTRP